MKIADRKAGAEVPCPRCAQRIIVPTPDSSPRPGILVEPGPARSPDTDDDVPEITSPPPQSTLPPRPLPLPPPPTPQSEPQDLPEETDDDESWYRERKRKRTLTGRWRAATLVALAISLVTFFVPWVNISVDAGRGRKLSLFTQSGFHLIFAGGSPSPLVRPFMKELEEAEDRKLRFQGLDPARVRIEYVTDHGVFRLLTYPLGLAIAAALVYFNRPTSRTLWQVGGVLMGTWLIAFVPFAWSTPTEDALIATLVKDRGIEGIATSAYIDVNYTIGFSVALWTLLLTALGQVAFLTLFAEPGSIRRTWKSMTES